jgi:hypothetical protein
LAADYDGFRRASPASYVSAEMIRLAIRSQQEAKIMNPEANPCEMGSEAGIVSNPGDYDSLR